MRESGVLGRSRKFRTRRRRPVMVKRLTSLVKLGCRMRGPRHLCLGRFGLVLQGRLPSLTRLVNRLTITGRRRLVRTLRLLPSTQLSFFCSILRRLTSQVKLGTILRSILPPPFLPSPLIPSPPPHPQGRSGPRGRERKPPPPHTSPRRGGGRGGEGVGVGFVGIGEEVFDPPRVHFPRVDRPRPWRICGWGVWFGVWGSIGLCLGPYGGPRGGGLFLMSEVPLYA